MSNIPFFSLETWILLITFICLFVINGTWTFGIFEKLGVPGPKPVMYWGSVLKNTNHVYYLADKAWAEKYGKVWGVFEFKKPSLCVMDPEMLKTILVKDCFTYFTNRRDFFLNGDIYDSIFTAKNAEWKRIRNNLSPNFSSGRIKEMFSIMKHHSRKLLTCLQSKANNDEVITLKQFFGGYGLDVLAGCVFSGDTDTINNPSHPMMIHVPKLFKLPIPLFIFQAMFPIFLPLLKLLGFTFFCRDSSNVMKTIVEKSRAERNKMSHQNHRDMLQNMINSQATTQPKNKKQNEGLTDHEIISQVTLFMSGGYDTSANTLCFLAYLMATNPEVMKRLQEEIDSTFPDKSPVEYEALIGMEYLDSVVSECLRIYPPSPRLERQAKETTKVNGITIPKDMLVTVPVYALHHDPDLWPQPDKFKPDRFSKENKQNINPYSYLPFGVGPRNCIGMRFALVMIKLALVEILQNYSFVVCSQTEIPLTFDSQGILAPLNPIKLKLATREKI